VAASRIAKDLSRWGVRLGIDADGRSATGTAERLATVVAAIAPHLDADALGVLARYSLWAIALDDRLDAPEADPAALRALADRVCRIVTGDRYAGPDAVLSALVDLLHRLRTYGVDGVLLARMGGALCDAVRAAVDHAARCRAIRCGREPVPSLAEYLALGQRDVNYRSFAYGLVLLTGDRLPVDAVERIDAALTPASRAVRLANDLRSANRDRADGRLNALRVPDRAGAPPSAAAVRGYVADLVRRHDRILRDAPPVWARTRLALINSLRVSVGLYRVGDLR
jgi:hypothetical protein